MYFTKEEIVAKITQISHQRHLHDTDLSKLQLMLNTHKKYQVSQLRRQFQQSIGNMQRITRQNQSVLDLLKYRCEKLTKQGVKVNNQLINIEALKEYFMEFKQKIQKQRSRGDQIICGRQKWQIMDGANHNQQNDEGQSLLGSHKAIKQSKQMALNVYENVTEQGSRIEQARVKMGNVLKNINFAGNIAQMLRTRTAQDNRLIVKLTILLFIQIIFCLFVVRPWWRGE